MSEERAKLLDRMVLLHPYFSYTRRKLIQFLSTTAQKAVHCIGGSKKVQMNIGGVLSYIVRYPTKKKGCQIGYGYYVY